MRHSATRSLLGDVMTLLLFQVYLVSMALGSVEAYSKMTLSLKTRL